MSIMRHSIILPRAAKLPIFCWRWSNFLTGHSYNYPSILIIGQSFYLSIYLSISLSWLLVNILFIYLSIYLDYRSIFLFNYLCVNLDYKVIKEPFFPLTDLNYQIFSFILPKSFFFGFLWNIKKHFCQVVNEN